MSEPPWSTPKEAVAYALACFPDDAEELHVSAFWQRGRVFCTTSIRVPSGHWIFTPATSTKEGDDD